MHNVYVSSLRCGKLIEFPVDPGALTLELAVQPTQGLTLEVNALIKAMKDIPETQRDVVPMFGYEGTICENIAAPLNIPIGTIKSRVSRGWSALQLAMHG